MIIPTYQRLGSSSHQLAKAVGELAGKKSTHTGTLDPMAEGVLMVLTGQDRFSKSALSHVKKWYQFEILWGVATDSLDLLGLVTSSPNQLGVDPASLEHFLVKLSQAQSQLLGQSPQIQPAFSAKRVDGESSFDRAKAQMPTPQVVNQITIDDFSLLNSEFVPPTTIIDQLQKADSQLHLVEGDFRQGPIFDAWQKWLTSLPNNSQSVLLKTRHQVSCSKRTYVRALVRDLSIEIGLPATTFHILRTQNGPYKIEDCLCLV